ncbi:glycoside hydrolase family 88 protein (plasmid) [Rhizobium leguminosarum]|jgi:unsaturated chondroitin disaccharide hydrolase|uniref:Glucoronyl hydrolase n=1 Tax=Rhizobium leguminosarum TaxID=384 RepID=A0A6P0D549_RHILE|nr:MULTISPECIES: glycoside hydrolase family 88 protein [Rhizobium]MDH6660388.1 unsaturated chondroitin disaccharide hydrolase [Rhizobium sophorae]ASS58420.1 glucoronyl hydrolase [Rhizobium leguminosarum bv. viciae]AVC46713.1 glycosyl Hydrolase Family 88 family protein [Rhizobium leguminosarum bv. viciae]MBB4329569.1 unsaturated chondroitin disaccharide hydrolase [Rhizobium leguminosarum]MBB4342587.1 unsaturated chondroitin disaccharide hydrolase [Rhizobium leguminosarum]
MNAVSSVAPQPITDQEVKAALDLAVGQIRRNLPAFTHASQNHSSVGNFYPAVANDQWTAGFWPGELWLAFEHSGEAVFRDAAQIQVQSFLHRIVNRIETDHHDMGFLYSPSCIAAWKLVGDEDGRRAAILAADQLIERFQPVGQFIQAWGRKGVAEEYRYIIDCLLNLPLLYWASRETGDPKYREIALIHARTTLANSVRPDDSTYHTFYMDPVTGAPVRGATKQGYRDDSAWARGQAWAISGMALSYRYERIEEYRQTFDRLLAFYLNRLPADMVPYWDLVFSDGDGEPRDSSSASITACGLLEMADLVEPEPAARYRTLARRMMKSLADHYAVKDPAVSNGLVLHATYSKKSPFNTCRGEGVDECVSWGDYYYMEALTRLSRSWSSYW